MATIGFEVSADDFCSIAVDPSPGLDGVQIAIDASDGQLCLDLPDKYFEILLKTLLVHQFKRPSEESDEQFLKRAIRALELVDGVNEHGVASAMPYSALKPPICIHADRSDRSADGLQLNYHKAGIYMNGDTEVYDRICFNFANLTIELYDDRTPTEPIATVPLIC